MTDENARAVSFANSYFTLVDGLVFGLEDYLSDNVILDWFGRTVRGKRNVNTFMKTHKVNSRHIFNNIVPTEGIGYRKYNLNRKIINLLSNTEQIKNSKSFSENVENSSHLLQTTDIEGNHMKEEGASYEFNDNDLNALNKFEITPTMVNEIEGNIQKLKTLKIEETEIMGANRVKFVQAIGEMHLWKKRQAEDSYDTFPEPSHVWKRPCKLQIAYSLIKSEPLDNSTNFNTDQKLKLDISKFQTKRLPNFEEISKLSSRLVPNINNFGGYLRQMNFSEDRDNFLKSFGAELAASESLFPQYVPQYVGNRLVFCRKNDSNFVFNYKIHMIIYEGDNRCKLKLSQKLAERE